MHPIYQQVHAVQVRQQRRKVWECVSAGVLAGGILGCLLAVAHLMTGGMFSWVWTLLVITVCAIAGMVTGFVRSPSLISSARFLDQRFHLKDRTLTALRFLTSSNQDVFRRLQVEDAAQHLSGMDAGIVVPIIAPRSWRWGITLSAVAVLLSLLAEPRELPASVAIENDTVRIEADRIAESVEELKELADRESTPELQELLKQMNRQIEGLKKPGTDIREALARLSEMESSLEELQKQLSDPAAVAQLREIGEALSLAESTSAAGQALSRGDFEKASAALAEMGMPKLDRQTEKAMVEKLSESGKKSDRNPGKPQIGEAAKKMAEGLEAGDKERFEEGADGLARESRIQGKQKELADLLKKQAQLLGESKSQFENESRIQAQGPQKGGNKAGRGTAGTPVGDIRDKKGTGAELKLTGQDSGSGDVEKETETDLQQENNAVRQYRQVAEKYEALSESAMELESIPPGHRRTIRRYFELIRPQNTDMDALDMDAIRSTIDQSSGN